MEETSIFQWWDSLYTNIKSTQTLFIEAATTNWTMYFFVKFEKSIIVSKDQTSFFAGEGPVSDDFFFLCYHFHCLIYGVWWNITQNNRLYPSLRVNILK